MEKDKNLTFAEQQFADFESQEVSFLPFEPFPEDWHDVEVKMAIVTTDFMTGLREPKPKPADQRPVWRDATIQLLAYFEAENHTGATRRFSKYGYEKFDDLLKSNPEKAAQCTREGVQGYAVTKDKKTRIINAEATQAAGLILNRMLTAAGVPAGTKGPAICDALIGKKLKIMVTKHIFEGNEFTDVTNFASIDTPMEALARIPAPGKKEVVEVPATVEED